MKFIVGVYDANGNLLPDKDFQIEGSDNILKIHLQRKDDEFTDDELYLFKHLIKEVVHDGVPIELAREYIELYDKIQKIKNRNECK